MLVICLGALLFILATVLRTSILACVALCSYCPAFTTLMPSSKFAFVMNLALQVSSLHTAKNSFFHFYFLNDSVNNDLHLLVSVYVK